MNGNAARFFWLGGSFVGLVALGCVLTGEAAKPARRGIALPTDWSHSHLIFSQPRSAEQAMRLQEDPRFEQQWYRRYQPLLEARGPEAGSTGLSAESGKSTRRTGQMHRDWSKDLGSGGSVGAGNYPAKFSFDSSVASCADAAQPDFVVYSTGPAGSGTQASIVAYDNLYVGCTGTVPSVYWAYNTGGPILTSPVFSRDGTQLAFTQTVGGIGSLVLLKWAASASETVASPGIPLSVIPALYSACPAPCMTSFILQDTHGVPADDKTSSVFYDYGTDTAWVGDSDNRLHRFSPVFAAASTPAEVGSPWPVQLQPTFATPLTSPVHDRVSGNVFVADAGGFLYSVSASTGAVTQSGLLDFGNGFASGPIVDSGNGLVYVFASSDGSAACLNGADCTAVYQFSTGFAANDLGTEAIVGNSTITGNPPSRMFEGDFDNAYYNSTSGTGNLYVCGNTGGNPTLYVVPISAGALDATGVTVATLASSTVPCSPVTNVFSPGATAGSAATERLFLSVQSNSSAAICSTSGGCVQNFIDTPWQASTTFAVGQEILVKSASPLTRFIDVVTTAGTSGTTQPSWPSPAGVTRVDGGVNWINQGNPSIPVANWAPTHPYPLRARILDSNGNVEIATNTVTGTSGSGPPIWPATPGVTTTDNTVTWISAGALFTDALASTGGASGIIIDNTVLPGTLAGASQVYFSTLSNQACDDGTGGCAVQASQSALK